jgi:hypothetical protein
MSNDDLKNLMGNEFDHASNHFKAKEITKKPDTTTVRNYAKELEEFFELHEEEKENLNRMSEEIFGEYEEVYRALEDEVYDIKKMGRFGMLKSGEIVEIDSYTIPDGRGDEQELYFTTEDGETGWAFYSDFLYFAHNESVLERNPIGFGDIVVLKDIPVSRFLELDTTMKENYDLYIGKLGIVTQTLFESFQYAVAY